MPRRPAKDQLEAYRKQQVEIARKIKAAENLRREKARRDELRRKLVLGAALLDYYARPDKLAQRPDFLKALFKDRKLGAADLALVRDLMRRPEERGGTNS